MNEICNDQHKGTRLVSTYDTAKITSAGFIVIDYTNRKARCYGESVSLGLKADPKDSKRATFELFGYF